MQLNGITLKRGLTLSLPALMVFILMIVANVVRCIMNVNLQ